LICELCKENVNVENDIHWVLFNGDFSDDSPVICKSCMDFYITINNIDKLKLNKKITETKSLWGLK